MQIEPVGKLSVAKLASGLQSCAFRVSAQWTNDIHGRCLAGLLALSKAIAADPETDGDTNRLLIHRLDRADPACFDPIPEPLSVGVEQPGLMRTACRARGFFRDTFNLPTK